ncbi:hypothetical protein VTI28DRAFT_277 [Corynascus sepedonium]
MTNSDTSPIPATTLPQTMVPSRAERRGNVLEALGTTEVVKLPNNDTSSNSAATNPRTMTPTPGTRSLAKPYDPGSLSDIMRRHANVRLHVLPFRWTDLHTRLLEMCFNEQLDIASESSTTKKPLEPSQKGRKLLDDLDTLEASPEKASNKKTCAMTDLMSTLFPATLSFPETNVVLPLSFGRHSYEAVQIPCLWRSHQSTGTLSNSVLGYGRETSTKYEPILAFVNMPYIAQLRKKISKRLVPENADQDPYIAAILLVMAQAHFYKTGTSTPSQFNLNDNYRPNHTPAPLFHDVKVQVITHHGHGDAANFVVYTAIVTATFLTRFMLPYKNATRQDGSSGMEISYNKVHAYPLLGLRKRLAGALGSSTVGDLIPDDADLLKESQPARPIVTNKRSARNVSRKSRPESSRERKEKCDGLDES